MNVRGSKYKPESYVARNENTQSSYHADLELSDRSREGLEMKTRGHGYHEDLELSDRSRVTRDLDNPLEIALCVVSR